MVKAVVFDMDGVMYDTERLSHEAWKKACREMGCSIREEDLLSFRGCTQKGNEQRYMKFKGTNGISYKELRARRNALMQKEFASRGIPVKKGLYDLLDFLKTSGITVGVATGTDRSIAEGYWEKTNVKKYFSFTICGGEAGRGKPEPDIYQKAASLAGVKPEECIVIEDSPNGIRAGYAAGCITVMVPDIDQPDEDLRPLCRYICRDLDEVMDIIKKINADSM